MQLYYIAIDPIKREQVTSVSTNCDIWHVGRRKQLTVAGEQFRRAASLQQPERSADEVARSGEQPFGLKIIG